MWTEQAGGGCRCAAGNLLAATMHPQSNRELRGGWVAVPGRRGVGSCSMSPFATAIGDFIDAVTGGRAWVEELNDHSHRLAQLYPTATAHEVNDALGRLAALFPNVPLVALGHVAITCGSLAERGGDPMIAGPAMLERLPRVNETATDFYTRCRAQAEADAELITELRTRATEDASEEIDASSLTAPALVEEHVANQGWDSLAQRFGPRLFQTQPASVLGHMAERFFRLGLIAHLSRSKGLRAQARYRPELLEQTVQADAAANTPHSFLGILLRVLDDEPLLILHVEQRKGFEIRIGGLADNFQLHTLLAGALIGSPDLGLVSGEAPSQCAVAECRDAPVARQGGEYVTGAFNLWNWVGLQAEGRLPDGQTEGSAHWIWNEGCPADIVPFEGRRVVLLGPPPYSRHWRAGRSFSGMVGELTVERRLSEAEVAEWLARLTRAATT
jgi:hypothetical protein